MAIAFFTPIGYATLSVGSVSSNVAVVGSPAAAVVTNMGPNPVAVLIGAGSSLAVTPTTGFILQAGQTVSLAAASGQFLAAISLGGSPATSSLYIAFGS